MPWRTVPLLPQMAAATRMVEELSRGRAGISLRRAFYGDLDYHRLDLAHLYYRTWLFAGHECELPTRRHFLTLQVGDYPLVLVRGNDGAIRPFHSPAAVQDDEISRVQQHDLGGDLRRQALIPRGMALLALGIEACGVERFDIVRVPLAGIEAPVPPASSERSRRDVHCRSVARDGRRRYGHASS